MREEELKKLAGILLNISEDMLIYGADVARVEDTTRHMAESYELDCIDVYVTTTIIIITIGKDGLNCTDTRRITSKPDNNFEIIEKLNALSRKMSKYPISIDELEYESKEVLKNKPREWKMVLGYFIAACAFSCFFDGKLTDGLLAGLCSIELYYSTKLLGPYCSNRAFHHFLISFINGMFIAFIYHCIPTADIDILIIGDIMLQIPGVALTSSFQNILVGDTTSGINQLIESLLWALALGAGYGLSIIVTGVF